MLLNKTLTKIIFLIACGFFVKYGIYKQNFGYQLEIILNAIELNRFLPLPQVLGPFE